MLHDVAEAFLGDTVEDMLHVGGERAWVHVARLQQDIEREAALDEPCELFHELAQAPLFDRFRAQLIQDHLHLSECCTHE